MHSGPEPRPEDGVTVIVPAHNEEASIGGVLRWCGFAVTTELIALIALQTLHGLTFACLHLGAMRFIAQQVGERQMASAQSLYDGVALGFVFGVVMAITGQTYAQWQGQTFLLMALCSALAVAALFRCTRNRRD